MAEPDDIEYLKRLAPDEVTSLYTDAELSDMIDAHGVRGSARQLWEQRVTQTAGFADITEGSSTRKMSQVHDNAKKMVASFSDGATTEVAAGTGHARVHKITRGEE